MPDIWMDVDTALSEVPVNILPLIDDTDFKTIEDAIAYNAAGMDLTWNFATAAGAFTSTSVTPTSAGVHDWNEHTADDGMYTLEIPASGGTINNDTEGTGWFTGVITGVLPFRGPTIGFRAAALNDAMIDGGDVLDVNLTEMGGTAQSATDLKDFADAGYDPATNKVQGVVLADTVTTLTGHTAQTADHTAGIADIPTVAEFNARTIASASYFDPAVDTVANVTLVATTTTNTDMRGTDSAATAAALATAQTDLDTLTGADGATLASAQPNTVAFAAGVTIDNPSGDGLAITSSGGNGDGLSAAGNGAGHGLAATGGIVGNGLHALGGATAGVGVVATTPSIGYGLSVTGAGGVANINGMDFDDIAGTIDAGQIGTDAIGAAELAADAVTEIQSGLATAAALTTHDGKLDTVDSNVDAILLDTNELQTDWANGGRLDLLLDAVALEATVAALNDLSAANVNAEVVDALATDTYAEPGQGAPAATATIAAKINYLYKWARNKVEQTSTTMSIYDDAGTTVDQKSTVSDDGTTYTRGEIGTGP